MHINKIELSENKRSIDYIREYIATVYTPIKTFSINIIIEDTPLNKMINIQFLEDCFYPILDAKKSIINYIKKHNL
jgi:hypothetical protein